MGAVFSVPWTRLPDWGGALPSLPSAASRRSRSRWPATRCRSRKPSPSIDRVALVLGSEGHGLSSRWEQAADRRAIIPIAGGVDSLNVAAAAAVACYVTARRRPSPSAHARPIPDPAGRLAVPPHAPDRRAVERSAVGRRLAVLLRRGDDEGARADARAGGAARGRGGPQQCHHCKPSEHTIWADDLWHVNAGFMPMSIPFVAGLAPNRHCRSTRHRSRYSGLGPLMQRLSTAVKAIPGVARAHFARWGDGSEHFHMWVLARPLGMMQGRGAMLAFWDDVLPRMPAAMQAEHIRIVAEALAAGGGAAFPNEPDRPRPARRSSPGRPRRPTARRPRRTAARRSAPATRRCPARRSRGACARRGRCARARP